MKKITLNVPGISCNHCVHTIKTELSDLAGVKSVTADAQTKLVEVEFEDPASENAIRELLQEINYPAM